MIYSLIVLHFFTNIRSKKARAEMHNYVLAVLLGLAAASPAPTPSAINPFAGDDDFVAGGACTASVCVGNERSVCTQYALSVASSRPNHAS